MKIKKWYFGINETGLPGYDRMIRAAVKSCRANTSLQPVCIYSGGDVSALSWLESQGVQVIRHQSTLYDAIMATEETSYWKRATATGAYLRVDIPLFETHDPFVLYTDVDVLFLRHPHVTEWPEFFACAPEHDPDNWSYANTGAMVINVENMAREHDALVDFASTRLSTFGPLGAGTYDQGALNAFFKGRWSKLPLELNWKPYWGVNADAQVVHFHGPKATHIHRILREDPAIPKVLYGLFNRNVPGMCYYLGLFDAFDQAGTDERYLGRVERLIPEGETTVIVGWVVDRLGGTTRTLRVEVDGNSIQPSEIRVADRPDVVRAVPGASSRSGFRIRIATPEPLELARLQVFPGNAVVGLKR